MIKYIRSMIDVEDTNKEVNREEAPDFLSPLATPEQRVKHYIEHRWSDQYQYYTFKADQNRRRHLRLQTFIAIVAVIVPVLLGFNADIMNWVNGSVLAGGFSGPLSFLNLIMTNDNLPRWTSFINAVPAILSGLVAAATALENVQKYGDNWRAFQSASDGLERERALFESNAGPYRTATDAYSLFVERSEDVIAQETGRYFAREEQQGEDDPEDDPEDIIAELMGWEEEDDDDDNVVSSNSGTSDMDMSSFMTPEPNTAR
jgi:hypothetical protein